MDFQSTLLEQLGPAATVDSFSIPAYYWERKEKQKQSQWSTRGRKNTTGTSVIQLQAANQSLTVGVTHQLIHSIKKSPCFPGGPGSKDTACNARRPGFDPWVGKIPWRKKGQPSPLFLPGKSHEQRSLEATIHGVTKKLPFTHWISTMCQATEITLWLPRRSQSEFSKGSQPDEAKKKLSYIKKEAGEGVTGAYVHAHSVVCDPMECSLPGSSVHGISQARMLEWVAMSFSRGSSCPRDWTHGSSVSCIGRQVLPAEQPGKHRRNKIQPWNQPGESPLGAQELILEEWAGFHTWPLTSRN